MPKKIRELKGMLSRSGWMETIMKSNRKQDAVSRYSVIIQWSEDDNAYVVTLPEWGGCHTHGATYEEAAKNAREALEGLIEGEEKAGRELPPAHQFMFPGPPGFTYELNHMTATGRTQRASA